MLKKGEVAHMEANASLLKEVVHREYRRRVRGCQLPDRQGRTLPHGLNSRQISGDRHKH
jgi:hypothetical protein